jgi:hypothetical protein
MIRLQAFAFFGLLCFSIGAFAAPASSDASSAGSNLTLADIINEPVIAVPLADPSFIPILTQNNQTVVDTNPAVQSQVDNIPSVISSISAAAATATAAATTTKPTTTAGSKVRRNAPTLPPSPIYVRPLNPSFRGFSY